MFPKLSGDRSLKEIEFSVILIDVSLVYLRMFICVSAFNAFRYHIFVFSICESVENKKTSRPDVKAYCQTFGTRVFFVVIPNCLDINLNFFGCIF